MVTTIVSKLRPVIVKVAIPTILLVNDELSILKFDSTLKLMGCP